MGVSVRDVNITSAFWSSLRESCRKKTIPRIIEVQKSTGHWDCLKWKEGHDIQPHPFWDSDIYKVVEAACYFLMTHEDEELLAQVEEAVDNIRAAQHSDGYINSYYTVWGIKDRWTNTRDMHELYCLGHLIEACVAYETLTKSGRLLEPVLSVVRHIDSVFGSEPGKKRGYPGHQEVEIGLLRLFELTDDPLPLKVAQYFLTERGARDENGDQYWDHEARARGNDPNDYQSSNMRPVYRWPRDYAYHQADTQLVDAQEVVGHSVRAMYYYTAATNLVRLTGHQDFRPALSRLWRDLVDKNLYVTGGLGAIRQWEGFGPPYLLGNTEEDGTCYAETCATFALIVWCQKLLELDLKSEYGDIMEIALYNGFLGSVSLDGETFYYQNPLRTLTGHPKERSRWFEVACCPPNVAKLMGNLGTFIYSLHEGYVAIHLYIESTLEVPGTESTVSIKTNAPWSGDVKVTWKGTVALALRIPSWAGDYKSSIEGTVKDGYLYLPASTDGNLELIFAMQAQAVYPNVKTGKHEVCIMRGPLVYCIEDVDNDLDVDNVVLTMSSVNDGPQIEIANNLVITVLVKGREARNSDTTKLYSSKPWVYSEEKDIVFTPFYSRANRGGNGGMRVWCSLK